MTLLRPTDHPLDVITSYAQQISALSVVIRNGAAALDEQDEGLSPRVISRSLMAIEELADAIEAAGNILVDREVDQATLPQPGKAG